MVFVLKVLYCLLGDNMLVLENIILLLGDNNKFILFVKVSFDFLFLRFW